MAKTESERLVETVDQATAQDERDLDSISERIDAHGLNALFDEADRAIPGLYNRTFIKLRLVSCGAFAIAAVAHDPFWLVPLVLWTMFLVEVQGAATCIKLLK